MFRFSTLKSLFLALFAILGWSSMAQAQTCGFTATASASGGTYDPFNPSGQAATITLSLIRKDSPTNNGFKTAVVAFYLQSTSANANGIHIIPTSVTVAGNFAFLAGQDIFYGTDEPAKPFMGPPTDTTVPVGSNAYLKIAFTGNDAASNPAVVTFSVVLPANLNLTTSTTLPFDAVMRCTTTGGGPQTDQNGTVPNAISFPITVLSALQASFVGTSLDFGEVGDVTDALASTRTTGSAFDSSPNYVRVQSSGVYTVQVTSLNGYRLKHPTGPIGNPVNVINYRLNFLGQTRSVSNTTPINVTCTRAGIGAVNEDRLNILGTLEQGGAGKTPSLGGNYSDTLSITITPQVDTVVSNNDCPGLPVP